MNTIFQVPLGCTPQQTASLKALQQEFARACNALAPVARDTRCWNRVALHHMTYRSLRERFPQLGSQMACNAIYSVSRACRLIYQSPGSPFNLTRLAGRPLPLLQFAPTAPVYFDRHTLSLKDGRMSMFTLDGRMRFDLNLAAADERRFHQEKLLEIILSSRENVFTLSFVLGATASPEAAALAITATAGDPAAAAPIEAIPDFLQVLPDSQATHSGVAS